jgi:hypothetical protein
LNLVAYPGYLHADRRLEVESGGASTRDEDAASLFSKLDFQIGFAVHDLSTNSRQRQVFVFGTFAPALRASDRPMAIACFVLVTLLPDLPLRNVPAFRSCMTSFTFFCAVVLAEVFLAAPFFAPALFVAVLRASVALLSAVLRAVIAGSLTLLWVSWIFGRQ